MAISHADQPLASTTFALPPVILIDFDPQANATNGIGLSGSNGAGGIYDVIGQEVRRLVSEQKIAGRYHMQWDARDNLGRSVSSGVYIAKVSAGSCSASQKMLLLK